MIARRAPRCMGLGALPRPRERSAPAGLRVRRTPPAAPLRGPGLRRRAKGRPQARRESQSVSGGRGRAGARPTRARRAKVTKRCARGAGRSPPRKRAGGGARRRVKCLRLCPSCPTTVREGPLRRGRLALPSRRRSAAGSSPWAARARKEWRSPSRHPAQARRTRCSPPRGLTTSSCTCRTGCSPGPAGPARTAQNGCSSGTSIFVVTACTRSPGIASRSSTMQRTSPHGPRAPPLRQCPRRAPGSN